MRMTRPTPEYVAGIISGCGLGLTIGGWVQLEGWRLLAWGIGAVLIAIGSTMAYHAQQPLREKDKANADNIPKPKH
jgi:hypothetical protein